MHDKYGNPLKDGDVVRVEGVIGNLSANPEYCNCTVRNVTPLATGQVTFAVTLNTTQVELAPPMAAFTFDDVVGFAKDLIAHLERHGDEYLSLATRTIRIVALARQGQWLLTLAEINSGVTDAKKLIAAIRADFQLE